jgi:hypothetical protein
MGAFCMLELTAKLYSGNELLTLSSLMACTRQKFSVFMLSHFFPSLFYNTTQQITSIHGFLNIKKIILHDLFVMSTFFLQTISKTHLTSNYGCKPLQNAHPAYGGTALFHHRFTPCT